MGQIREYFPSPEFQKWMVDEGSFGYKRPGERAKNAQLEYEKAHFAPIVYLYERLCRPYLPKDDKVFFSAESPEKVALAEELFRKIHQVFYPDGPFIVVDVEKLLENSGKEPQNFHRDEIFLEALRQLQPETANEFKDNSYATYLKFGEIARDHDRTGRRIALFIKNIDALTSHLEDGLVNNFMLGTFRTGVRINRYGHTRTRKGANLGGKAGMSINDTHIIWEENY